MATGLQKKFDWAGVAAAGVSGGVSERLVAQASETSPPTSSAVSPRRRRARSSPAPISATTSSLCCPCAGRTIGNAVAGKYSFFDRQQSRIYGP